MRQNKSENDRSREEGEEIQWEYDLASPTYYHSALLIAILFILILVAVVIVIVIVIVILLGFIQRGCPI
jgi:type IV secretory pathway component VirB8